MDDGLVLDFHVIQSHKLVSVTYSLIGGVSGSDSGGSDSGGSGSDSGVSGTDSGVSGTDSGVVMIVVWRW